MPACPTLRELHKSRHSQTTRQLAFDCCRGDQGTEERVAEGHADRAIAASLSVRDLSGILGFTRRKLVEPIAPPRNAFHEARSGLRSDRLLCRISGRLGQEDLAFSGREGRRPRHLDCSRSTPLGGRDTEFESVFVDCDSLELPFNNRGGPITRSLAADFSFSRGSRCV